VAHRGQGPRSPSASPSPNSAAPPKAAEPAGGAGPVRQCAVSRQRAPRDALVRLVAGPDGQVVVDLRGRLPGRGVWILPDPSVLAALPRRAPALARQLGVAALDADAVVESLRGAVLRALRLALTQAAAGGLVVLGHDALVGALRAGRVASVAVASDAAPRTVRSLRAAAEASDRTGAGAPGGGTEGGPDVVVGFVTLPWDADALGAALGRGSLAAGGILRARPNRWAASLLRQWSALG
jgi:predicted RNA-binding protein YlxR (DUF448 family)